MSSESSLRIDKTYKKKDVIEEVKANHDNRFPVYLIPADDESINTVFFVSDVFRRNGHFVQSLTNTSETGENVVCIYIHFMSNAVIEKQITREDTLQSLQNEAPNQSGGSFKLIRACGTACATAWKYSNWLISSGQWRQCGEIIINAIPVKIENKMIYKTTIQINLQKVSFWVELHQ